jgi:integrase
MARNVFDEGRVFKRGNIWWIAYCVEGEEIRESSGSPEKRVAEAFLKQRLTEKAASKAGIAPFSGPQRTTLAELLDRLLDDYRMRERKSLATTHYHLQPVRRLLEGCTAIEVNGPKIKWYIARRLEEGAKNATINRELAAIRRAFHLGKAAGQVREVPPFPSLSENNVRRGFFEWQDAETIIRFLPDYLKDLAWFTFYTGWRRGEVTALQWDMVNRVERLITLTTTKNNRGRVLALEGELWEIIERRWADRALVPWVFHRHGQRIQRFYKAWATACQAAGIPGRHFHDFRRTTVRNLTRAGVREKVAMDLTGHKTRSVFDRYNITSESDLREAAKQLQGYLNTVRVLPSKIAPDEGVNS